MGGGSEEVVVVGGHVCVCVFVCEGWECFVGTRVAVVKMGERSVQWRPPDDGGCGLDDSPTSNPPPLPSLPLQLADCNPPVPPPCFAPPLPLPAHWPASPPTPHHPLPTGCTPRYPRTARAPAPGRRRVWCWRWGRRCRWTGGAWPTFCGTFSCSAAQTGCVACPPLQLCVCLKRVRLLFPYPPPHPHFRPACVEARRVSPPTPSLGASGFSPSDHPPACAGSRNEVCICCS